MSLSNQQLKRVSDYHMVIIKKMRAEYKAQREAERKRNKKAMMFLIPLTLLVCITAYYIQREPEMYLKETPCLKREKTDTFSFVGVGPNPLDWRATHEPCIEYGETTLRINPAYLEWAAAERAEQAARERAAAEAEAYYEDEEEY